MVQIQPHGRSGEHVPLRGVLSGAEMDRPLYSCLSESGDVGHLGRAVTLVKQLLAAGAIPEGLTVLPTAGAASPS